MLPVVTMAFGMLSATPPAAREKFGTGPARILLRWGVEAVTPLPVLLLVYGGRADGPAELPGPWLLLGVSAVSWLLIGMSVRPGRFAAANGGPDMAAPR